VNTSTFCICATSIIYQTFKSILNRCKIAKIMLVSIVIFHTIGLGNHPVNQLLTYQLNESLVLLLFISDLFNDMPVAQTLSLYGRMIGE
jgi:hypothetical protein